MKIDGINTSEIEEKEFSLSIVEVLQKEIKVRASSDSEAIRIAKELYFNEDIVLNSENHVSTDIECI